MRIHLVCYEDPDSWICGKIARRLAEALGKIGQDCVLGRLPDDSADINHHVIYLNYNGSSRGVHTLMVTHIDDALKLRKLQAGLATAQAAICASAESVARLAGLGLDESKLCHVNPAHDGNFRSRPFVVGITTRLYPDGRKHEADLVRLSKVVSPDDFAFTIMGFGWAAIVADLRARGFAVEYHENFNYEKYIELMRTLDYFLYLSGDEGSMGFIDALAAGVKTIVQPQGFHLDATNGITHAFTTFEDLQRVFAGIAKEKRVRQDAVRDWTWDNYARQHLAIWEKCRLGRPLNEPAGPGERAPTTGSLKLRCQLWVNVFSNRVRSLFNVGKDFDCDSRLWQQRHARKRSKK
jgi:hypothetical protein